MVIGAAGQLPKPPPEKIVFLEDMTDFQLADAVSVARYDPLPDI
jgi:ubiquitin carboxyl-terminal hydrolase 14